MLSITKNYNDIPSVLETEVMVSKPNGTIHFLCTAIWDTGATNSMISEEVALALKLKEDGFAAIAGFHGTDKRPNYEVSITFLDNKDLRFEKLKVIGATALDDCGFLIGMDIIGQLDFAITNARSKTIHSIRHPSFAKIDFEASIFSVNKEKPTAWCFSPLRIEWPAKDKPLQ